MRRSRIILVLALTALLGALAAAPANASSSLNDKHMRIVYLSFHPNRAYVKPGQTIDITNIDGIMRGIPHSLMSDDEGATFDTGVFFDYTTLVAPSTPGVYHYHCDVHDFMHGVLIVSGG